MTEIPRTIADRLSICGITLRNAPFPDQLQIIAESGCTGIGIFHGLIPSGMDNVAIRDALDRNGLRASICVPAPFTILPRSSYQSTVGQLVVQGDEPPGSVEAMITSLKWLAPLRPQSVIVIPGAQGARSAEEAWALVRTNLARLAEVAGDLGLTLALEPVHPRFATDFTIISTIDQALRMIEEVGRPNIGVLIEIFHVWDTADLPGQIKRAAGKIAGVQLSDSALFPRSQVDRLPPGEGCADIAGIVRMIEATGYSGWYDIEIVSDDGSLGQGAYPDSVWRRSPQAIADDCVKGSMRALLTAGLGAS